MAIDLSARVAAANAAPYDAMSFSTGITGADFIYTQGNMRTRVRVWRGYKVDDLETVGPGGEEVDKDGRIYLELKPDEEILVWLYETKRELETAEFGVFQKGSTAVSNLPDEIEFATRDRVLVYDTSGTMLRTCGFTTSGDERDELPYPFVAELETVIADSQVLTEGFELVVESDGKSYIQWDSIPAAAMITYRYHPKYTYWELDRTPPKGSNGKRLPQRGILNMQQRGENE